MESNQPQLADPKAELIPIACEALANSPMYLNHICYTLSECGQSLRAGNDQDGLNYFARGASDLGEFIQLFGRMSTVAKSDKVDKTEAFKNNLLSVMKSLEGAINRFDFVTLTDEIDSKLVPLLQSWEDVEQELASGLEQQLKSYES